MTELPQNSRSRWKPRFSLLTTLLLMTIVGLVIVVIRLWSEVGPLRSEVGRLRTEQGLLVIDDESRVHAIRLPSLVPDDLWKYRVYVPPGVRCRAVLVVNKIPYSGWPSIRRPLPSTILGTTATATFADLEAGEHLLTVGVVKDSNRKNCVAFERYGPGAPRLSHLPRIDEQEWPRKESGNIASVEGVSETTQAASDQGELVLMRYRRSYHSEDADWLGPYDDGTLTDGFMLWIEPMSATSVLTGGLR